MKTSELINKLDKGALFCRRPKTKWGHSLTNTPTFCTGVHQSKI